MSDEDMFLMHIIYIYRTVLYNQDPEHKDLLELLQWTLSNTNAFYRGLNHHAMWIPSAVAKRLAEHSWCMTAAFLQMLPVHILRSYVRHIIYSSFIIIPSYVKPRKALEPLRTRLPSFGGVSSK